VERSGYHVLLTTPLPVPQAPRRRQWMLHAPLRDGPAASPPRMERERGGFKIRPPCRAAAHHHRTIPWGRGRCDGEKGALSLAY
jgi:hypothetical protein